jgi:hypothetical protein
MQHCMLGGTYRMLSLLIYVETNKTGVYKFVHQGKLEHLASFLKQEYTILVKYIEIKKNCITAFRRS